MVQISLLNPLIQLKHWNLLILLLVLIIQSKVVYPSALFEDLSISLGAILVPVESEDQEESYVKDEDQGKTYPSDSKVKISPG